MDKIIIDELDKMAKKIDNATAAIEELKKQPKSATRDSEITRHRSVAAYALKRAEKIHKTGKLPTVGKKSTNAVPVNKVRAIIAERTGAAAKPIVVPEPPMAANATLSREDIISIAVAASMAAMGMQKDL